MKGTSLFFDQKGAEDSYHRQDQGDEKSHPVTPGSVENPYAQIGPETPRQMMNGRDKTGDEPHMVQPVKTSDQGRR